ncbi:hypothetical protein [Nocardia sp. NPDC050406]|uniref:hypothetical protein n=1 Tax=Nocardia sp. NPDC050406 TaxID=3364318 RepID=UPI003789E147
MTTYDRRAFALAYIEASSIADIGIDGERTGYPEALREHRTAVLTGLERLFGLTLRQEAMPTNLSPVFMVFRSVARSYLSITGPMDGYLEAGLIHKRLEEAGVHDDFLRGIGRIADLNAESRAAHLHLLTTLLGVLLGDHADRVVEAEELRAIGVNTVPPNPSDYEF